MVNAGLTTARDAERALAIGYAPPARRAGLAALFALDARLSEVLATTRAPLAGQLRLAWWREALAALDDGVVAAEPVLAALARDALPLGARGGALAPICDGWEQLLVEPLDNAAIIAFAAARGGTLFVEAARLLGGADDRVATAGEGWALADLARRLSDDVVVRQARILSRGRLAHAFAHRWPLALRPLGALALLARADLDGIPPGSPRRVARLAWHRLTGR